MVTTLGTSIITPVENISTIIFINRMKTEFLLVYEEEKTLIKHYYEKCVNLRTALLLCSYV